MLLRTTTREKIRMQFTEEEKAALNAAITGEAICPRGCTVDVDKLPGELRGKLTAAVREVANA